MAVGRYLVLVSLLFAHLSADNLGSIGFVSPSYPPYSKQPSQDIAEFFDDFMSMAYDNLGDAGVAVVNRLNLKRGSVRYKDVIFDGVTLIPSEDNEDAIEKFYDSKSIHFLKEISKKNSVDVILYSTFPPTKFRKIFKLRKKEHITTFNYMISVFTLQSGAKKNKNIKVDVNDLFSTPDYDIDALQAAIESNYIILFQKILGQMQIIGSAFSDDKAIKSNSALEKNSADSADSSSGGDW